jgi:plasmid stabilization system protein ParE
MMAVFSSGANRDVNRILEYYSTEASVDVAMDFHAELDAMVDRIKQWPESFPLIGEDLRRAILRRFPYQVVYRIQSADKIRVLVIRHHKQHPDFGLDR